MQWKNEQSRCQHPPKLNRRSLLTTASATVCTLLVSGLAPGIAAHAADIAPAGRLILLGTQGGPNFSLTRAEPANALLVGEHLFLIDCGYGALAGMLRAELGLNALDAIFLTHLHDDHTTDLLAILTHMASQGRARDVVIYGPPGTDALVAALRASLTPNATIRVADEARPDGFLAFIKSVEVAPGQTFALDPALQVSCSENTHFPKEIGGLRGQRSYAYRFDWGRSIVFSGDTTYSEALIALAEGTDVFVCEVLEPNAMRIAFDRMVAAGAFAGAAEGVWRHMLATHATPEQVGRMAARAHAKRVVLTHLAPGALLELPDSAFENGVGQTYDGPVIVGKDGMIVQI